PLPKLEDLKINSHVLKSAGTKWRKISKHWLFQAPVTLSGFSKRTNQETCVRVHILIPNLNLSRVFKYQVHSFFTFQQRREYKSFDSTIKSHSCPTNFGPQTRFPVVPL